MSEPSDAAVSAANDIWCGRTGYGPAHRIQSAIDAACAEKDKRIADLEAQGHEEFREQNDCIRRLRERIAALEAILEKVPHQKVYRRKGFNERGSFDYCNSDCPRCKFEGMGKENAN